MCGLVGIAGSLDHKAVKVFNDLLFFNQLRGSDSTGVASVDRDPGRKLNKDTYMIKAAVPAAILQQMKGYDRVVSQARFVLLGHGRAATVGKINQVNAHPFEFSELIGTHNGTISHMNKMEIPDHANFDTDSQALYNAINELGVENVIPNMTGGAWALVWYDKSDHSINFLRNSERPLCYALANEGKSIIWASEPDMMRAACRRNGLECDDVWWVPEDRHYKFVIPEKAGDVIPEPVRVAVKRKEPAPYKVQDNFRQRPPPLDGMGRPQGPVSSLKQTANPFQGVLSTVVNLDKYRKGRKIGVEKKILGWNGKALDQEQYEKLTGKTCAYSDEIVEWDDLIKQSIKIAFINETQFVVEDYNDPITHMFYQYGKTV